MRLHGFLIFAFIWWLISVLLYYAVMQQSTGTLESAPVGGTFVSTGTSLPLLSSPNQYSCGNSLRRSPWKEYRFMRGLVLLVFLVLTTSLLDGYGDYSFAYGQIDIFLNFA